jgi:hypothetical protein
MGIVAVAVQWAGSEDLNATRMHRWFARIVVASLVGPLALTAVHTMLVVPVQILGGQQRVRFVVGLTRPTRPPCTAGISDAECIKRLTLDRSAIESFWGSPDKTVQILPAHRIFGICRYVRGLGRHFNFETSQTVTSFELGTDVIDNKDRAVCGKHEESRQRFISKLTKTDPRLAATLPH